MTQDILFSERDGLGLVTLNRPKALNALTTEMALAFQAQLNQWAADDAVAAVVVRGAGDRAFCAGGDIRALYGAEDRVSVGGAFYRAEYRLNRTIFRFPKPYVALMDGVVMGGGVGLSVHGSHRVVTERTLFAMPETGIGLFPDIGASHFLPRCPGQIGRYLGLTGARIEAADCLYARLATHYVEGDGLDALTDRLAVSDKSSGAIATALGTAAPAEAPALAARRQTIDRCFAPDDVAAILARLDEDGGSWADETAATLRTRSPTSLRLTLRQLQQGNGLSFEDVMRMEFRLSQRCMSGRDFFEGVRAVVIDKDNTPRWQPATLDAVTDAEIDAYFAPLAEELDFA